MRVEFFFVCLGFGEGKGFVSGFFSRGVKSCGGCVVSSFEIKGKDFVLFVWDSVFGC